MRSRTIVFLILIISLGFIPMAHGDPDKYELDITRDLIEGIEDWGLIGHTDDSQTTETTIWDLPSRYVFPPVASSMTVSSADVNDDYLDTGAWSVIIQGLDINYLEIEELVFLDGQNPVNTTNEFYRINYFQIIGSGTSETNEGHLYLGTGAVVGGIPANIYGLIDAGYGNVFTAVYTVPADKTLYINRIWLTTYTNKFFTVYGRAWTPPSGGVGGNMTTFIKFEAHVSQSFIERTVNPPIAIPPKSSIEYTSFSDQAGGQVNIEIRGVLVDEEAPGLQIGDISWLLSIIWLVLTGIGLGKENKILTMFAGFFGIILGLLLLGDSEMVSIALILLNLYLVYAGSQ